MQKNVNNGIYSINFSNKKRYIGMSNDIKKRINEHKNDSKKGSLLPVHQAMKKYSYEIEILEDCSNKSRKDMGEREKFWISYYNTFEDKNKGYNLTPGGDGASFGVLNPSAKLNEKTLAEVYDLLINHKELYIYEIAARYNISSEAISAINCGKRYYNEFFSYPLRPSPKPNVKNGFENHLAKFSSLEAIQKIYSELEETNLSLEEIAKKHHVSYTTISKINRGLSYVDKSKKYPIRKEKKPVSNTNYEEIIALLKNTDKTFSKIAEEVGLSASTIGRINRGKIHYMENQKYPIRQ